LYLSAGKLLTFGRTSEHFVTIPSTHTKFPRNDEVKVLGVTCFAPKLSTSNYAMLAFSSALNMQTNAHISLQLKNSKGTTSNTADNFLKTPIEPKDETLTKGYYHRCQIVPFMSKFQIL